MADISQIKLPDNTTYNLKDNNAYHPSDPAQSAYTALNDGDYVPTYTTGSAKKKFTLKNLYDWIFSKLPTVSKDTKGLAPKGAAVSTQSQSTKFLREDGSWAAPSYTSQYSLPLAANGTRGGVQIGYTQSGKNYPVELSDEKMYVNVPWTDVGDGTLTITQNGTSKGTFTANQSGNSTIDIDVHNGVATANNLTPTEDTPAAWVSLLGSPSSTNYYVTYYNTASKFTNQPSTYGILETVIYGASSSSGNMIYQRWKTIASGDMYYRSGNNTGWNGTSGASGAFTQIIPTDENVKIISTNPTSTTTYYPTWVDSSGTKGENINNGFAYLSRNGTTSQDGVAVVQAGNAIASGTANNKKGYFRVYNKNSNYATIGYNDSATSDAAHTLPATGGTIVNNNTFRSQATVTTTENGLMTGTDKAKLDNIDNTKDVDKNVNSATKITKTETVLQTNQVPYVSRASLSPEGFSGYIREKIVGGTITWNQKIPKTATTTTYAGITFTNNDDGSWTLTGTASNNNSFKNIQTTTRTLNFLPNHVYYVSAKSGNDKVGLAIMQNNLSNWTSKYIYNTESIVKISDYTISDTSSYGCWARLQVSNALNVDIGTCTYYPMVVDLTLMFGTAIANYIYNLETATAGTGVYYLKSLGLLTKPYYEYDDGSIQSVCVKEKKIITGAHIDTIPLSATELRGVALKDANNNLCYDGDEYTSDGKIKRKYKRVNMGTLNWTYSTNNYFYTLDLTDKAYNQHNVCAIYTLDTSAVASMADKTFKGSTSNYNLYVKDSAYTDAATFKTAMDGVYLVYELAEPTEETLVPYQNPQYANGGTEEFVDGLTRDMIVPVGHVTEYMGATSGEYQVMPTMPVDDGKYVLTADKHEVVWERKGWKFYKQAFSNMNIDNFILLNADEIMLVAHWGKAGGITYDDTKIVPVSYLLESVYFYSAMGFYGNENTNCFVEIEGYFNADNNGSGITFSGWTIDSGVISSAYFRLYYR